MNTEVILIEEKSVDHRLRLLNTVIKQTPAEMAGGDVKPALLHSKISPGLVWGLQPKISTYRQKREIESDRERSVS